MGVGELFPSMHVRDARCFGYEEQPGENYDALNLSLFPCRRGTLSLFPLAREAFPFPLSPSESSETKSDKARPSESMRDQVRPSEIK